MFAYILRRLILIIPTLLGIMTINFFILPLFIDVISNQEIFGLLQIGVIFTMIGLVRKYAIRRWFENMRKY